MTEDEKFQSKYYQYLGNNHPRKQKKKIVP